jgi:hypothetical protein
MKELLTRVCQATGLDDTAALPAIGHVLLRFRWAARRKYPRDVQPQRPHHLAPQLPPESEPGLRRSNIGVAPRP